jgi:hypothetical protein
MYYYTGNSTGTTWSSEYVDSSAYDALGEANLVMLGNVPHIVYALYVGYGSYGAIYELRHAVKPTGNPSWNMTTLWNGSGFRTLCAVPDNRLGIYVALAGGYGSLLHVSDSGAVRSFFDTLGLPPIACASNGLEFGVLQEDYSNAYQLSYAGHIWIK